MFNAEIIREYDIRGIYNNTLMDHDAFLIGWTFGQYIRSHLSNKKSFVVNVCRDGRHSSKSLATRLIDGLLAAGISVNDLGMGPTPMLYFSTFFGNAIGGVMVTGSHNPPEYNGFKFILNKQPFFGKQIECLYDLSHKYLLAEYEGEANAKLDHPDFVEKYTDLLFTTFPKTSALKVAWDPGNGAAAVVLNQLCKKLPGTHILLNSKVDGDFPSHHPDPTVPKNLEQLIDTVRQEQCDLGIAFDGDGDRIGTVDSAGRIVWGDQLLSMFAKDILKRHPGAAIIGDVKASNVFFQEVKRLGGQAIMCKTGHSNIKKKIKETGALLAGEMSGHIFIAEHYFGYDDALYAAVRLVELVVRTKTTLAKMLDDIPKVNNTPEIRITCPENLKFKIIDEIQRVMKQKTIDFMNVDGIRCNTPDGGWWLLRASNTENVLICRFEAPSDQAIEEQKRFVTELLEPYREFLQGELVLASV